MTNQLVELIVDESKWLTGSMGLFIGSLIFLASGQSFEQFRGIG